VAVVQPRNGATMADVSVARGGVSARKFGRLENDEEVGVGCGSCGCLWVGGVRVCRSCGCEVIVDV
jgi:hypothetical protein